MSGEHTNAGTEKAGILIKTTLVDFPGTVACAFFLRGCNLRCPYCYNTELVSAGGTEDGFITVEQLFSHLEKRKNVLSGLAVSGGEPLLNPRLPEILAYAKSLGYKTKLDTNGTLPDRLRNIVENPKTHPDFIAMDIKTAPGRYAELCGGKTFFEGKDAVSLLSKSIRIIAEYPADKREFRTVLVPGLVEENDLYEISKLLPKDACWMLAQFQNGSCLNSSYNEISPFPDKRLKELEAIAKSLIQNAALR